MEIEYRKLSEKELDVFIEMRINQFTEENGKERACCGSRPPALLLSETARARLWDCIR